MPRRSASRASGFKTGRDEIKVTDVKLASEGTLEPPAPEALDGGPLTWYMSVVRNVSLGIIAIVAVVFAVLYYRRRSSALPGDANPVPQDAAAPRDSGPAGPRGSRSVTGSLDRRADAHSDHGIAPGGVRGIAIRLMQTPGGVDGRHNGD